MLILYYNIKPMNLDPKSSCIFLLQALNLTPTQQNAEWVHPALPSQGNYTKLWSNEVIHRHREESKGGGLKSWQIIGGDKFKAIA